MEIENLKLILVYKKVSDYDYEQRYIVKGEDIPEGFSVEKPDVIEMPLVIPKVVQDQLDAQAKAIEDLTQMIIDLQGVEK